MDKSWYVCRHTFITTEAKPREQVKAILGCGFLPSDCTKDLEKAMATYWGQAANATNNFMCSGYAMDYIPKSCRGTVGLIRQDVAGKDIPVWRPTVLL
jgi:hypothetical protein